MPLALIAAVAAGAAAGAYVFGEGTTSTLVKIGGGMAAGWLLATKL